VGVVGLPARLAQVVLVDDDEQQQAGQVVQCGVVFGQRRQRLEALGQQPLVELAVLPFGGPVLSDERGAFVALPDRLDDVGEGGGRLVVEMTPDEATALGDALKTAVG